jgi:pyruvate carboxylase
MVPVREGELIVELEPVPASCASCGKPLVADSFTFCPYCGVKTESEA